MTKKRREPLFDRLKAGLEDGIAHARGELPLKTVEAPDAMPANDSPAPSPHPRDEIVHEGV